MLRDTSKRITLSNSFVLLKASKYNFAENGSPYIWPYTKLVPACYGNRYVTEERIPTSDSL